jgi:hypothetical protein
MSKQTIGIAVAVAVLLIAGAVWAFRGDDPLPKIKQMREEIAALPRDQQREGWDRLRKEIQNLTPEQRDKLGAERQAERQRREDKRIDDYFAQPPAKRNAYLDKQIQEEEKRRKEREARRAQGGQNRNPNARNSGQNGPAPGPNGANAGGQRGGGRNASPDARSAARNQRLDNSSPEQRAKRAAYHAAVQQRRIAAGLPLSPGRRPGGGR